MTGTRRRWPPHDKLLPREDDHPAYFAPMTEAIGDLSKALEHLAPSVVIGEGLYQLDAAGQAAEQYRAPFAALAVTSTSGFPLIIAAGPKGIAAPGPGPGSSVVPAYGPVSVNMKGNAWTLYGGAPGDLVTVQALARPVAPAAAVGTFAPAKPVWSNLAGGAGVTLVASGQSPVLAIAPYSTLLLQVSVLGAVTGAGAAAVLTISGLDALGNLYPVASTPALTAAGIAALSAGPGTAGAPTPAVNQIPLAATGVAAYNNNSAGVLQTIAGGTVTATAVNGTATGLTAGTFFVPAGEIGRASCRERV